MTTNTLQFCFALNATTAYLQQNEGDLSASFIHFQLTAMDSENWSSVTEYTNFILNILAATLHIHDIPLLLYYRCKSHYVGKGAA